jgi:hypothetical protein
MTAIGNPTVIWQLGTPDEYRSFIRARRAAEGVPPALRVAPDPLPAFVSEGRWVVECPCGNGPSAHPEWLLALCYFCGTEYSVTMPPDWRDVETELLKRPYPHQRNFLPDVELGVARKLGLAEAETLSSIIAENAKAGIA